MATTACVFCARAHLRAQDPARVVYEDDPFSVVHQAEAGEPAYLGSLIAVTKRHAQSFAELDAQESRAFGLLLRRVSRALKAATERGTPTPIPSARATDTCRPLSWRATMTCRRSTSASMWSAGQKPPR